MIQYIVAAGIGALLGSSGKKSKKMGHGGKTQGYDSRLDESLGMRKGAGRTKQQSRKDRRDESAAMERSMGRRKYASVGTMDKGRKKMAHGGQTDDLGNPTDPSVLKEMEVFIENEMPKLDEDRYFTYGMKRKEAKRRFYEKHGYGAYGMDLFAHGGMHRQGYDDKLDESLAMRRGAGRTKQQSRKDRRDESAGMERSMGRRKYASVGTMDRGRRKMAHGGIAHTDSLHQEIRDFLMSQGMNPKNYTILEGDRRLTKPFAWVDLHSGKLRGGFATEADALQALKKFLQERYGLLTSMAHGGQTERLKKALDVYDDLLKRFGITDDDVFVSEGYGQISWSDALNGKMSKGFFKSPETAYEDVNRYLRREYGQGKKMAHGGYAKGGKIDFSNRTSDDFRLGELVYDTYNKDYGTIIGIFDQSLSDKYEVRLDSDGMQPTANLRKLGEKGDSGSKKQLFDAVSAYERLLRSFPDMDYPPMINNPFYAKGGKTSSAEERAFAEYMEDYDVDREEAEEQFLGEFDSKADWAAEFVDDTGGMESLIDPERFYRIDKVGFRQFAMEEAYSRALDIEEYNAYEYAEKFDLEEEYEEAVEEDKLDDFIQMLREEEEQALQDDFMLNYSTAEAIINRFGPNYGMDLEALENAHLIRADYEEVADALEDDGYVFIEEDFKTFVFNPNMARGGRTKRKKVSDFDKLAMKVAARYRAEGKSNKKAMEIGRGTAAKVFRQQQAKKR